MGQSKESAQIENLSRFFWVKTKPNKCTKWKRSIHIGALQPIGYGVSDSLHRIECTVADCLIDIHLIMRAILVHLQIQSDRSDMRKSKGDRFKSHCHHCQCICLSCPFDGRYGLGVQMIICQKNLRNILIMLLCLVLIKFLSIFYEILFSYTCVKSAVQPDRIVHAC
jgi:hypothetical protein